MIRFLHERVIFVTSYLLHKESFKFCSINDLMPVIIHAKFHFNQINVNISDRAFCNLGL